MAEEHLQRKLTTIFAADVEGFTRHMRVDEEATLKTLVRYREIIDGLIDHHEGRIFSTGGDSGSGVGDEASGPQVRRRNRIEGGCTQVHHGPNGAVLMLGKSPSSSGRSKIVSMAMRSLSDCPGTT